MICLLFMGITSADAASKKEKKANLYRYELESYEGQVAQGQGHTIIKVWSYGKKEELTKKNCMKNAIHGLLFKGFAASSNRAAEKGKEPLVPEGYAAHKEYFDTFFVSDYLQYIQLTNNGQMMAGDIIMISKKEYKIGMVVMVDYDALRKRLEKDKIIKSLDFLF